MFCSVYYDELQAEYIVVGYDDFDPTYPNNHTHSGVIYRIYDECGDLTVDLIKEYHNFLFFGIEGSGSQYYICGEATLTGKILQGCWLSSEMVSHNTTPQNWPSISTHCWYNQISLIDDKIVCCGQSSAGFNSEKSVPILTVFDRSSGNIINEDIFHDWDKIYSIFPNNIGSYIIELYDRSNDITLIASCDMMLRNTGKHILTIE